MPGWPLVFMALEVVHKETIDFTGLNLLINSTLMLNIGVMWISGSFCGILFCRFFGGLQVPEF